MEYAYGNWVMVFFNVVIFLIFLKSVFKPKTKTDWKTYRIFGAFLIALFAEMYGFPLTIYLLTSYVGNRFLNLDFSHNSGHILNTIFGIQGDPHFSIFHIASYVLIFAGFMIIARAWNVLYKAQKDKILATTGPYGYVRHPQYAGFILIIIGFLLQWPTLITVAMAPILIIRYIRLGKEEEKDVAKHFGTEYTRYKMKTPAYFPSIKKVFQTVFSKLSVSL